MKFRDPAKNEESPPLYDPKGSEFTMSIHSGGELSMDMGEYVGGHYNKFDFVNANRFELESLRQYNNYTGYSGGQFMYTKNVNGKFEEFRTSAEFKRLCKETVTECKELDIYVTGFEIEVDNIEPNDVEDYNGGGNNSEISYGGESNSEDSDYVVGDDSHKSDDINFDRDERSSKDEPVLDDGSGDDDVLANNHDENFDSAKDSDTDNEGHHYPVFDTSQKYNPEMSLNMVFSNKWEFLDAVHSLAVVNRRDIKIAKNDNIRVYAKCNDGGCDWKVHALNLLGEPTFQIRTYHPTHTCPQVYNVKSLKTKWLKGKYGHQFVNQPSRKVSAFQTDMMIELGVNVTDYQAHTCKKQALEDQHGLANEQFSLLWDYAEEVRRTNVGSSVAIKTEESNGIYLFDKMYVCLSALKEGFLIGCRRLIGVDGCHLKGPHKGVLLTAVGVDPNNNIFPIAYSVVSKEDGDTWDWFLNLLKLDLKMEKEDEWTFISDKQKGLVQAFQKVFPKSAHSFCVRHLYGNLRNAGFKGQAYKIALYKASKATTENQYNRAMDDLKELSEQVVQWLSDKPPEQWCRSHFTSNPLCDMVMNNICESFNSSILPAREMPILSMLEWIMEYLMKKIQIKKDRANRGKRWKGLLCPKIQTIINTEVLKMGSCVPIKSDDTHYQIRIAGGTQYAVNLEERTCGCKKWDMTGIPCVHAIRAICCQGLKPEDFTHQLYRVSTYKMVYGSCIMPINGRSEWIPTGIAPPMPPKFVKPIGRPPKARRRESDEVAPKRKRSKLSVFKVKRKQTTLNCGKCHQPGHNRRLCQNMILSPNQVLNEVEGNIHDDVDMRSQINNQFEENLQNFFGGSGSVNLQENQLLNESQFSSVVPAKESTRASKKKPKKAAIHLVAPTQKPPSVYHQLMQGSTTDTDHLIAKEGRKFVILSNLSSGIVEKGKEKANNSGKGKGKVK